MERILKISIIILPIPWVGMGWVMVVRIGVERVVAGGLEIGMEDLFLNNVVVGIVSLGVEGVIPVMLAMMRLTAEIGFMMMDKMNLAKSEMRMLLEDNRSWNLMD